MEPRSGRDPVSEALRRWDELESATRPAGGGDETAAGGDETVAVADETRFLRAVHWRIARAEMEDGAAAEATPGWLRGPLAALAGEWRAVVWFAASVPVLIAMQAGARPALAAATVAFTALALLERALAAESLRETVLAQGRETV